MDARNFLKVKNFKIEEEDFEFSDVKFMSAKEKSKIYKNFITFLNNHFKPTAFNKNIYEHCHLHCGFIAHYNINGFYGEYFETAARFHKIANNVEKKPTEYDDFYVGNLKYEGKDSLASKEAFYGIYDEINTQRVGLGEFYNTLLNNRNYGGYSDYSDLDRAIRSAFNSYLEIWRYEIKLAIKSFNQFSKDNEVTKLQKEQEEALKKAQELKEKAQEIENKLIEQSNTKNENQFNKQLSLFDFLEKEAV